MSQIKSQSAGAYFTAIIDNKKYTIKPETKEYRENIKKQIQAYNIKPTDNRMKTIIKLMTPKLEKAKTELLVIKKQVKNKEKKAKKEIGEKSQAVSKVVQAVEKIVEQKEEVKQEQLVQVYELAQHLRYKGYVNPITGKTWNGEKYV